MSSIDPYQPPKSDLSLPTESVSELATLGGRFVAALIDGVISMVMVVPLMYLMGLFDYAGQGEEPPFLLMLASSVISFALFATVHLVLLKKHGQTIGKRVMKIRIVDMNGVKPDLATLLFKRYLPVNAVGLIPMLGQFLPLADVLFIFRRDRRCVHDLIAGTQVVRVTQ
ncbi:MAG TPA: RDD family protein [Gammaproteobacteria bacterium]